MLILYLPFTHISRDLGVQTHKHGSINSVGNSGHEFIWNGTVKLNGRNGHKTSKKV